MRNQTLQTTKLLLIFALAGLAQFAACKRSQQIAPPAPVSDPTVAQPTAAQTGVAAAPQVTDKRKGFFDHDRQEHRGVVLGENNTTGCASCHQRDAAKPADAKLTQPGRTTATWLPFHDACAACHNQETFQQTAPATLAQNPFCAVCHQGGISQENRALLAAYPTRLQEFGLGGVANQHPGFSHRTHTDAAKMGATDREDAARAKCATCHQFDGRGVKASFPSHQTCFQCHAHQAGQALAGCNVCHVVTAQAVSFIRGPEAAFHQFKFRHSAAHLKAASCDRCHRLNAETALTNPRAIDILKISTGQGKRHTSACWTCHQQAKEPICTKCHTAVPSI